MKGQRRRCSSMTCTFLHLLALLHQLRASLLHLALLQHCRKCQLLGQRIQMQKVSRDSNEGPVTNCYDLHFFCRILAAYDSFNKSEGPNCRRCSGMTKRAVGRGCYDLHFSCPISAASAASILAASGFAVGANACN